MEREKLFRGKRTDNGEWVCGDLLQDVESGICAIVSYVNLGGNIHDLSESCIFAVIPETVGQCTGSIDKNRTKIFEGDIVQAFTRYGTKHIYPIKYRNGTFWFGNWNWIEFLDRFQFREAIGNIHDPELLGGDPNDQM